MLLCCLREIELIRIKLYFQVRGGAVIEMPWPISKVLAALQCQRVPPMR